MSTDETSSTAKPGSTAAAGSEAVITPTAAPKRSWKSKAAEFFVWFLVSVLVAVVLVMMSESLLPANF